MIAARMLGGIVPSAISFLQLKKLDIGVSVVKLKCSFSSRPLRE